LLIYILIVYLYIVLLLIKIVKMLKPFKIGINEGGGKLNNS